MAKKIRKRMPRAEARSIAIAGSAGFYSGSFGRESLAGTVVDEHNALSITAVWQAVRIFADTIAGLNLYVAEGERDGAHSAARDHPAYDLVHSRPNRVMTSFRIRQALVGHVMTYGNGYAEIERDAKGRPRFLHLLDPRNVLPHLDDSGDLWYRLQRERRDVPRRDVVHLAGLGFDGLRGYCPVTLFRESLGLTMAQEQYAGSTYGNRAEPQGLIEFPGDPKQEAVERFRDNWNRRHQGPSRAATLGILTGGAKWVATAFSPEDAQLILSRNFSVAEVARIYNVPQHMLGNLERATFSNIEEQNIQFYQLSLMPWLANFEQELDAKLLGPLERSRFFVRHNPKGLLKGNMAARAAYNTAMFNLGALSINEIRMEDGLNPIDGPGGDKHWIPVNNLAAVEDLDGSAPIPADQLDPDDSTELPTEQGPGDDTPSVFLPGEIDSARAATLAVDYSLESLAGAAS